MHTPSQFHYRRYLVTLKISTSTRSAYEVCLRDFDAWCRTQDGLPLEQVTLSDVQLYLESLRDTGRAHGTVRQRLSAIKKYYGWLADQGVVAESPVREFSIPHIEHKLRKALTVEQLRAIWRAAAPPRDRAIVGLLMINSLRLEDVSRADVAHLSEVQGFPILRLPRRKGRVDLPYTVLSPETRQDLDELCVGRIAGPLIHNSVGGPLERRSITRAVARIGNVAGLSEVITPSRLTQAMRLVAIGGGFTYSSVIRAAGEVDIQRLAQMVSLAPDDVSDTAAVRMANLVLPRSPEARRLRMAYDMISDADRPPAMAAALAGAALECFLRESCRARGMGIAEEGAKLSTYGERLRAAGHIRPSDIQILKRIEFIRNRAAHGWFDEVTDAEARWIHREASDFVERLGESGEA